MNVTTQRVCAWSGVVMMGIFGAGLFISGLFPPLEPDASLDEVTSFYGDDPTRMRAGLLLAFCGTGLWGPAFAIVTGRLQKISDVNPVLARVQSMAATAAWVFLTVPLLIFSAATFRTDRDPDALQAMSDLGWFMFIMAIIPFIPQALAIGLAILQDTGEKKVYPHWFGYFNIWVAVMFVPGGMLTFFDSGPLAWNGLFALWIPISAFGIWLLLLAYLTDEDIKRTAAADLERTSDVRAGTVPTSV